MKPSTCKLSNNEGTSMYTKRYLKVFGLVQRENEEFAQENLKEEKKASFWKAGRSEEESFTKNQNH